MRKIRDTCLPLSTDLDNSSLLDLGASASTEADEAWRILHNRMHRDLVRWLEKRLVDESVAEEIATAAWTQLFRHAHRHQGELSSVRSYLFQIAENRLKNRWRDLSRKPTVNVNILSGDEDTSEWWESATDKRRIRDPESDLEKRELGRTVEAALEDLDPLHRSAVRLRMEGWDYEQIAEQLEIPTGTVKSRLHRGRECLRQELRERGVDIGKVAAT